MGWQADFESLTTWALRNLDLRYAYLFAEAASKVSTSSGVYRAIETAVTLAIFEAYLGKGYRIGRGVDFERKYPSSKTGNPKRVDLSFKDGARGSKWAYVEAKYWNSNATLIEDDMRKLLAERVKMSRWMLIYRVRRPKDHSLESLLMSKTLAHQLTIEQSFSFDSYIDIKASSGRLVPQPGRCDVCLCSVSD